MTLTSWLLNSIVEPFFWSTLQWIWSQEELVEVNRLPAQLYGYSSTSLLIWTYEKVPHLVIIALLIIGCMTVIGTSVILSCCTGRALFYAVRFLCKYCVYRLILFVVFVARHVVRSLLIGSLISLKLLFRGIVILKVLIERRRSTYSDNRGAAVRHIDRPAIALGVQRTQEIEAAAFRPRRRSNRATSSL